MAAIALGVAFMSGTFTFTATLQHDLDSLLRAANAGTDVVVEHTAPAGEAGGNAGARLSVPATLLPDVRSVAGVDAADGVILDQAQLTTMDGKLAGSGPGIATSWRGSSTLDAMFPLHAGRPPAGPGEVAIDQTSATTDGYHVGDTARVVIAGRAQSFRVVGIVGFGTSNGPGRALTIFDLATAQQLFDKVGQYDEIDVVAGPGAGGADALRTRIAARLPAGVEAVTGAALAARSSADQAANLSFLTDVLLAFAGIALFVGAFVIWNTFSIVLAQRTRELALLRALGASRRQVFGSVVIEAGLVGVTASAVGVGLGLLAARGLAAALSVFGLDLPSQGPQVPAGPTILAVLTGTVITVVAALVPARRATEVPPVAAMRGAAPAPAPLTLRRTAAGLLLVAVGGAALALGLIGGLSGTALIAGGGAALIVLGVNLLTPLVVRPVVTVLAAPLSRLPGRTGRMARDNARHQPRRTAATATALMIGLAAVAGTTVLVTSLKSAAEAGIGRASRADLYVTSASSDTGFAPALAEQVAADPGVQISTEIRRSDAYVAGSPHQAVYGIDPATIEQLTDLGIASGGLDGLSAGGMLVSTAVASSHHWHTGSVVDVQFGQAGQRTITVAGTFAEKGPLGDYLLSLSTFDTATGRDQDELVLVRAAAGTQVHDLRTRLSTLLTDYPGVQVLDQAGYESSVGSMLDQLLALTTALLVLAVVIALLGIVNTLALSVTERTREIGVLRALGMGRGHLAATVTVEAAIIAIFGAVAGTGLGVGLGAALAEVLTGVSPDVPFGQLLAYLVIAVLAAMVAAAAPARRAARLDILAAIGVDGS
jgi:putative ABC transport system permease protein